MRVVQVVRIVMFKINSLAEVIDRISYDLVF